MREFMLIQLDIILFCVHHSARAPLSREHHSLSLAWHRRGHYRKETLFELWEPMSSLAVHGQQLEGKAMM